MAQVSKRWIRSPEKETFWRVHVAGQPSSGLSIRGYCRAHGLTEPLFYGWRREIARRDAERKDPVPRESRASRSGRIRVRSPKAAPPPGWRSAGVKACSARPAAAGLIAVKILDDPRPQSSSTLEIECPGGPVVRLREDVSLEVLQRVMTVCWRVPAEDAAMRAPVRSC